MLILQQIIQEYIVIYIAITVGGEPLKMLKAPKQSKVVFVVTSTQHPVSTTTYRLGGPVGTLVNAILRHSASNAP